MYPENRTWNLVTIMLAPDAQDLAVSVLFDLGATGTVTLNETPEAIEMAACFHADVSSETILHLLKEQLGRANLLGSLRKTEFKRVRDEDWLQKWKDGFESVEVGERLLIAPSWKVDELLADSSNPKLAEATDGTRSVGNRILIQIDPGMAFGTGTHATTRLCLEAIERHWKGGRFLDVGTGTGILAMAAAVLVPGSEVVAIDVDPLAVEIARQNLALNHLTSVRVSQGQPGQHASGDFDVVVANLTAAVITGVLQYLTRAINPSGCLILSGILTEQAADVALELEHSGFITQGRVDSGEWSCLVARARSRVRSESEATA